MYTIISTEYGFKLRFAGILTVTDLNKWTQDSVKALRDIKKKPFGVIIDMTEMMPLSQEAKDVLVKGQELYRRMGMKNSAVIVKTEILKMQMKNTAKVSGIDSTEMYFSIEDPGYERKATEWVNK